MLAHLFAWTTCLTIEAQTTERTEDGLNVDVQLETHLRDLHLGINDKLSDLSVNLGVVKCQAA